MAKRLFDILVAGSLLAVLWPVMVLVAFAEMSAIEKALRYGDVMRARLRDLIDKGIAHRTPDERDFDDDFRAGNEE